MLKRGALIVLEGCDRTGKSTQCRKLVNTLMEKNLFSEMVSFPDRNTATGQLIREYLSNNAEVNDRAIHLLFAANRWELSKKMERMLLDGITLIVDRYSFSGVVYSASKPGMDFNWCKQPEAGLLKPDLVFLLTISAEQLEKRPGFGSEKYETSEVQKQVAVLYNKLKDDSWIVVDADGSVDEVHDMLLPKILETMEKVKEKPVEKLW